MLILFNVIFLILFFPVSKKKSFHCIANEKTAPQTLPPFPNLEIQPI